ncbi:hypothetical protein P3T76_004674 [Phytophthora citrophthora]|uniref:Uncharacterized protein n=1 Tax=Phytophthora citrophthora TaxID=4793 RepID=A0AAD9GS79_9STRA|nr:hypothetical protein P3T76_004674 [Phytophthora citrophthora]
MGGKRGALQRNFDLTFRYFRLGLWRLEANWEMGMQRFAQGAAGRRTIHSSFISKELHRHDLQLGAMVTSEKHSFYGYKVRHPGFALVRWHEKYKNSKSCLPSCGNFDETRAKF